MNAIMVSIDLKSVLMEECPLERVTNAGRITKGKTSKANVAKPSSSDFKKTKRSTGKVKAKPKIKSTTTD
ncbi:hypothetical protein ACOSQ4_010264 [Xanthoceras sorbifolium]